MEVAVDDWLDSGCILTSAKGNVILGWGVPRRSSYAEPETFKQQFYFPGYFLDTPAPWYHYPNTCEISIKRLLDLLEENSGRPFRKPLWFQPEPESFFKAFDDLQSLFALGNMKKAVPYAFQHSSDNMYKERLINSLRSLLNYVSERPAFAYGLWGGGEGVLGATPEYLFLRSGSKTLETVACAGTAYSGRPLAEFINDEKELYEHRLVIEDIVSSLSSLGIVELGKTKAVPFGKLHHLVTPLRLNLNEEFDFDFLVDSLHPTAALGAFPKKPGMKWLKSFNCFIERGRFGAPAGYIDHGSNAAACYVAIRNVQWNPRGMKIFAGCGIVPGSERESEWKEIGGKMEAIREVLDL